VYSIRSGILRMLDIGQRANSPIVESKSVVLLVAVEMVSEKAHFKFNVQPFMCHRCVTSRVGHAVTPVSTVTPWLRKRKFSQSQVLVGIWAFYFKITVPSEFSVTFQ